MFHARKPAIPLSYIQVQQHEFFRWSRNDEVSFASIQRSNELIKTGKISVQDVINISRTRQKVLPCQYLNTAKPNLKVKPNRPIFTYVLPSGNISKLPSTLNKINGLCLGIGADKHILNPYNDAYLVNGPAAGTAAAVAAGIAQVGLAANGPEAILAPASFTGVVACRPNSAVANSLFDPDHIYRGWFTRSVADCITFTDLLYGSTNNYDFDFTLAQVKIIHPSYYSKHKKVQQCTVSAINKIEGKLAQKFEVSALDLRWPKGEELSVRRKYVSDSLIEVQEEVREKIDRFFTTLDFILTPAAHWLPPTKDQKSWSGVYGSALNHINNPSIVIPCGFITPDANPDYLLPIGLQVVANKNKSLLELLAFARLCEEQIFEPTHPLWDQLSLVQARVEKVRISALTVDVNIYVDQLKQIIAHKYDILFGNQRLIFEDVILANKAKLPYYGITLESIITIVDISSTDKYLAY